MHCNSLRLVLGLGLVRVSSRVRIRVKVRVSVMVRLDRTSWVVNFALFCSYRPVIYTRPHTLHQKSWGGPSKFFGGSGPPSGSALAGVAELGESIVSHAIIIICDCDVYCQLGHGTNHGRQRG